MTWPILSCVLLAAGIAVHLAWRRHSRVQQRAWERRWAEAEQQQAETGRRIRERQEALLNSMVEAVLLLDAGGKIQMANVAFHRLFATPAEVEGRLLIEAIRSHELSALLERLGREPTVRGCELRLAGPEERWLEVNAAACPGPGGAPEGYILVFHDLTRIKRLENVRQEFVANVSHELRTPVSMIKGYLESLRDSASHDPMLQERFLRVIGRNADRLALLVEDLLTISELESGRARLDLQPVDLRLLAAEVLGEFEPRATTRRIRLHNAVPDLRVLADANRLHQVFSNLVDNAVKYGRLEGCVEVTASRRDDDRVEICVHDDGPGLPPEALARVFERFYRADKARSREQGGTGLGLSIVKHLIQAHGERVWVESEPGHGARFCFTLRAVQ